MKPLVLLGMNLCSIGIFIFLVRNELDRNLRRAFAFLLCVAVFLATYNFFELVA